MLVLQASCRMSLAVLGFVDHRTSEPKLLKGAALPRIPEVENCFIFIISDFTWQED